MSNAVTLRLTKELSEATKNPDHQIFLKWGKPEASAAANGRMLVKCESPFSTLATPALAYPRYKTISLCNFVERLRSSLLIDDSDIMNIKAMITGPPDTP